MSRDEARQAIARAIDKTLDARNNPAFAGVLFDPSADLKFEKLEMDSLYVSELCMQIEEETGYECEPGELLLHPSLLALAQHISEQQSEKERAA